jgi:hypothetical protein
MENEVLTVGLLGLGVACLAAGIGVATWLGTQLRKLKDEILVELRRSHLEPAGARLVGVENGLAKLERQMNEHELYAERTFLSKATAGIVFDRLEKGLGELRTAIETATRGTEARLIRIESHLAPSSMLPPLNRRSEGGTGA